MANRREKAEAVTDFLFLGSKITQTVTAAMKLKDACFPGGAEVKASACSMGDLGLIPGSGRSPGEGNGKLLQYFCLENPMDGGAWWATVHGSQRVRHDCATSLSL